MQLRIDQLPFTVTTIPTEDKKLNHEKVSSKLNACGAFLLTLMLVAMPWTVSGQQVKRSSGSDAPRIRRTAPANAASLGARQRFLEMFARAYFPGRTGQLLIVPREGDFITRPDPDAEYMHGSPWAYDVSIPLMFTGPAVRTGVYSMPAVQQDVAPTLAAALGVQMPPTATGRVLPVLRTGFARPRAVMLLVLDGMRRDYFDRYAASMPTLTALRQRSAWFTQARVNFLPTNTAVGHSTINNYLLAVTADHGMPSEPSSPDRRHFAPSIVALLHEKFDPEAKQLIASFEPENSQIFVDEDRLSYLGLMLRDLAHFLESQPFLFAVFTNDDLRRAANAAKPVTPTRRDSKYN